MLIQIVVVDRFTQISCGFLPHYPIIHPTQLFQIFCASARKVSEHHSEAPRKTNSDGWGRKDHQPRTYHQKPEKRLDKKNTRKRQKTSPRFPNRSHAKCAYPPNPYLPAPTGKNTTTTNVICLHKRQPVGIDIQILAHGRRRSTWPPARRWRVEAWTPELEENTDSPG